MLLVKENTPYQIISFIMGILILLVPLTYIKYNGDMFLFKVTGFVSTTGSTFPFVLNTIPLLLVVLAITSLSILPTIFGCENMKKAWFNSFNIYLNVGYIVVVYFFYIIKFEGTGAVVRDGIIAVLLPLLNVAVLYLSNKKLRRIDMVV